LALMETCVELSNKALGPDHRVTKRRSDYLRWLKEIDNRLSIRQQLIRSRQECDQPLQESSAEHSPAITNTISPGERIVTLRKYQQSKTLAQRFFEDHPLLRASRNSPSSPQSYDIQEVD